MAVAPLHVKPDVLVDAWVCRIPRPLLQSLSANAGFHNRERVFFALLAEFFSHRTSGEGQISLPRLERLTGLPRTSIRRALADLQAAEIVQLIDPKAGRTRRWRLTGCTTYVHRAQQGRTQGAQQGDTKGGTDAVHPIKEERQGIVLKELRGGGFGRYGRRTDTGEDYAYGPDGQPLGEGEVW